MPMPSREQLGRAARAGKWLFDHAGFWTRVGSAMIGDPLGPTPFALTQGELR
jgi:hypothetical protein